MCYFYISHHGRVKKQAFSELFREKNRANLSKKLKLLRIRSELRKSGAYWGHWVRVNTLVHCTLYSVQCTVYSVASIQVMLLFLPGILPALS